MKALTWLAPCLGLGRGGFDNFRGPSLFLYGFASCLLLPCYRSLVVGARPGVGPEVLNGF